jgi:ATP-dependent DNA helicase RecQ
MNLETLLHTTFGFPAFRANQEAVCYAASDGRDVLLVMPTGAGKSLCYQLPAIARGGTALVISPLIALMDDQAAKLTAHGLRVARIHSGLSRDDSRQACRDYLDGALNFLFIAPERMRVPGFPEMLARRKPSLVAIDEAHCISAWGHDFRPDYRTLGDHLPSLRPAPIVALTATATPTVQRDIVAQLQLRDPALFIHGFRRSNLAIEVVEMSKPRRHAFTAELLKGAASRPAIVYAPSRKASEELAAELNHTLGRNSAAAYHAGLEPAVRERVQSAFQSGKLEVVVATIAFGMGIDKADVRTVVHTALPASVEAFYQEIGRAGRDGLPSRTVLLHSFADRKMHEFFFERDYPPADDLARVARVLTDDFLMPDPLAQSLKMDSYQFQKAVDKLIAQGAATIDVAGNVRRTAAATTSSWRAGYDAQIAFRRAQLDRMAAFAETQQCRMAALVHHFGDTADGLRPCGTCDFCSPNSTTAQTFAAPAPQQARDLRAILSALAHAPSRATGKLHTDLALGIDRRAFDVLLDSLARAGLITLTSETFTNSEGKVLPYKKAALTHEGRSDDASDLTGVVLPSTSTDTPSRPQRNRSPKSPRKSAPDPTAAYTPAQQQLDDALRAWRKAEAAKTGKPAFIVLSDKVIHNIAIACPRSIPELLTVAGIGPEKSDRYGGEIVAICCDKEAPAAFAKDPTVATRTPPSRPKRTEVERPPHFVRTADPADESPAEPGRAPRLARTTHPDESSQAAFHRPRPTTSDPSATLTPDQQTLDQRLRDWRKAESARLGAPPFLVLGSSALRSIVLVRPRTIAQLQTINGVGPEKARDFGPTILELCNA